MTPGDSQITVERLREIIELTLESEEEIPEEIGIIVQELVEEVVRLQLRVADLSGRGKMLDLGGDAFWDWTQRESQDLGIPLVKDLPGVSQNLRDHPKV